MSFDDALPPGTVVGEFEIRRVLGYGGFGIVYEAYEPMLDRRVALKEFFLRGFSRRDGDVVRPVNEGAAAELFGSGLNRFVREARLLSMLNERTRSDGSLVAVYRVFQANGTAFMAMKLYEGGTLKQWVRDDPARVTEAWLVRMLGRLLDALDGLHSLPGENLVHRDVSPDNIILQPDGTPVLLDFGATRKADDAQTSLIFKPGYSPIEQYTDSLPQGPWTDLYALCGVAYFAVTGQSPLPAVDRHAGAPFRTASDLGAGRFSPAFLAVIDHGMGVLPDQRYRSCKELRGALARLASGAELTLPQAARAETGGSAAPAADDDETTRVYGAPAAATGGTATQPWPPAAVPGGTMPASTPPVPAATPVPPPDDRPTAPPAAAPSALATATAPAAPATRSTGRRLPIVSLVLGAGLIVAAIGAWQWLKPAPIAQGDPHDRGGLQARVDNGPTVVAQADVPPLTGSGPQGIVAGHGTTAVPVATSRTPIPGLNCTAEQADWPCVLDGLARLSSAGSALQLKVLPQRTRIGDSFSLDIVPGSDGRLTVLGVNDRPDGKLVLVFPNAADTSDRLHAGYPLKLPRRPHWDLLAQAPTGRSYMIAVVTPEALKTPPALVEGLALQDAVAAFESGRPLSTLLGVPDCTPGATGCPKSLAIRAADFIIE